MADMPEEWVSPPEVSEVAVREATSKGWDEWCAVVDAWPGRSGGHRSIASHLEEHHGLDGWWAQSVTVGYERIRGLRLPHQAPDGTFTANRSKTMPAGDDLRTALLDDAARDEMLPGISTELRSNESSWAIRLAVVPDSGSAEVRITAAGHGRIKVTVEHSGLSAPDDVTRWKDYWAERLTEFADRRTPGVGAE